MTLTAHLTPGHTKGCTTWTLKVDDGGKSYDVVVVGSVSLNAANLGDNPGYPNIREDFVKSFKVLRSLPCDVFVGSHTGFLPDDGEIREVGTRRSRIPLSIRRGTRR